MGDVIINVFGGSRRPRPRRAGKVVFALGAASDVDAVPDVYQQTRRIPEEADVIQQILTEQVTTVRVAAFKDQRGKTVGVDGVPTWATDNSDLLKIEPSADGMSCKVTTTTMPGIAKLQVSADADLGPGVSLLVGTVEFVVAAPQAVAVELGVDVPVDVPAA